MKLQSLAALLLFLPLHAMAAGKPCFKAKGAIFFTADAGPAINTDAGDFYISDRPNSIPDRVLKILQNDVFAWVNGIYDVCPEADGPTGPNQIGSHYARVISASSLSISHPLGPKK